MQHIIPQFFSQVFNTKQSVFLKKKKKFSSGCAKRGKIIFSLDDII